MAWQRETGASDARAIDHQDFLTKLTAFATSQGVASVVPNSGGTGYSVGDILTYTHAGAFLDARFEVTKETGGVIDVDGLRIISSGAFSNRIATVAVNNGGTGYVANDIVEIQGGSSRCPGKAKVLTAPAGVVATIELFEAGTGKDRAGAYSVAPGLTGAATVGIGPAAYAGNDDLTVNITMTTLTTLTALPTTGGGNGDATVDITLSENGASVDGRNTNNATVNGITNEKEVTLVFDAAGRTNKPYAHFRSDTATEGLDTRYGIALFASTAHNPALAISAQPGFKGTPYILLDENITTSGEPSTFWLTCDGFRIGGNVNINPSAGTTDDAVEMNWYTGFGDPYAVETEDPYPYVLAGCSNTLNQDPSTTTASITGIAECRTPSGGQSPIYYYRSEDSTWITCVNSNNGSTTATQYHMFPVGEMHLTKDKISAFGPVTFESICPLARGSATRRLLPVPGTTPQHKPIPLIIINNEGATNVNETLDTVRVQLRGFFWISGSSDAAADITNFSQGKCEIGSDPTTAVRYRVFHQHVHHKAYHYICIKEDV